MSILKNAEIVSGKTQTKFTSSLRNYRLNIAQIEIDNIWIDLDPKEWRKLLKETLPDASIADPPNALIEIAKYAILNKDEKYIIQVCADCKENIVVMVTIEQNVDLGEWLDLTWVGSPGKWHAAILKALKEVDDTEPTPISHSIALAM